MKKVAIFAFRGDPMCFIHVLLNANDMKEKDYDVKLIVEGDATKLIPQMASSESPLNKQYLKAKELGVFKGACKACSAKLGVLEEVKKEGFALLDDMMGHPGMAGYINDGYDVITF